MATSVVAEPADYALGTGDIVKITVFQKPDLKYDLEYPRNGSLRLDVAIIDRTTFMVLRGDRHAY